MNVNIRSLRLVIGCPAAFETVAQVNKFSSILKKLCQFTKRFKQYRYHRQPNIIVSHGFKIKSHSLYTVTQAFVTDTTNHHLYKHLIQIISINIIQMNKP